ncbi:Uncharacterised protein [Mycobacterium tuberculosis]|uniref:Uncharacterized protein n=1 Tax=Mycobacterium tuberculosis TaxID=1773 RepID=A0A654U048_MYCTX|nr:Uncharacterised protein [Mycobacterium tuberculosis]
MGAIGRYATSPAFCRSTNGAIRSKLARTSALVITPWRSQLANNWLEIRSVARSSMSATSWMSGTFEQPTP